MTTSTKANVQNVPLSAIDNTIKTYQVREQGINEQQLESLTFSDRNTWDVLILKRLDNGKYAIVSGFHRDEAARRQVNIEVYNDSRYTTDEERRNALAHAIDTTTLKATIVPDGLDDTATRLFAYRYNSEHGLPLTIAEKKRYAVLIHLQNTDMPHYKIAQIAHISDKTVTSAIEEHYANEALKRDTEGTDETPEDETPEDGTPTPIDMEKRFKAFATQVRKFYTEVISELETDDEVTAFFMQAFTKPAILEDKGKGTYDGDVQVLRTVSKTMSQAVKRLTPKAIPTTNKSTKTEVTPVTTPEATPEATPEEQKV